MKKIKIKENPKTSSCIGYIYYLVLRLWAARFLDDMVDQWTPLQKEIISGLTAGSITTLVVHPLDLLKVRLQLSATNAQKVHYGPSTVIQEIVRSSVSNRHRTLNVVNELYRGLTINLCGNAIAWGVYFGLYGVTKELIYKLVAGPEQSQLKGASNDHKMNSLIYLSAGAASGSMTAILTNPIWVIKTRIMSTSKGAEGSYTSIYNGVQRLLRTEGIRGLWKGLVPALFGVSQGALYFTVYDTLKQKRLRRKDENGQNSHLTTLETIEITSLGKMISVTMVYPFQLLKSNLQSFKANEQNFRLLPLIRLIVANDGFVGLYKGLSANLVRAIPSTCITFCVYENLKHRL
ncbi:FLX1-like protein [Saccharomyces kudriavzevii IFO 1802]|uniref:FLX1-like protein n=2 Tax=Saccharomyces kudriavzevii (strain ATCC MYA-4449 / AS 2.2408 / CBS 8840 / NBRC 1802 / NCYC 2889) TaxID=226230 RepID=J4TUT1_SACK1|nr:FLX1-like protein [Saccharomyces kudriavzevii IFO 1802]